MIASTFLFPGAFSPQVTFAGNPRTPNLGPREIRKEGFESITRNRAPRDPGGWRGQGGRIHSARIRISPALSRKEGLAGILKGPKKGVKVEGDRKAGARLNAWVFGDKEGLGPETVYPDSRAVEWDLPGAGDCCDLRKPSCLLLPVHVAQHDCLGPGASVLTAEGHQLVRL